ncbi:MAG TPA: cupin domain-containing protein [Propionibacteriaceae bacterium]|nr:cupin domain-containing protein [Propionibacteriaceae bacterium]
MTFFSAYDEPAQGFAVVAGREHGLSRLVLAAGRVGPDQGGPLHLHHGEEILRILSGEAMVRVGDQQRQCGPGDVVIIPADVLHGFLTQSEVQMEVVAELDAGQIFPVTDERGHTELVEVYRADLPWGRPPPAGYAWTTDERMAEVTARAPGLARSGPDVDLCGETDPERP